MPRPGKIIPKVPLAKIIQENGGKRVADDCLESLSDYLEKYASEISERAIRIAKHSGRKTVQKEDIKLALK